MRSFRTRSKQFAGRNQKGTITVRHRGGGHKQAYRSLDWTRSYSIGIIVGYEYDPQRTAPIAKLFHPDAKAYSYILAPSGTHVFTEVYSYSKTIAPDKLLRTGDAAPLSFFEPGDFIHAVAAFPGQRPIFGRSAGNFCQIISFEQKSDTHVSINSKSFYAKVRLPSGNQRLISFDSHATLGTVGSVPSSTKNIMKAGRTRWLGWRPTVRGVAINPVDHPHGGGQGKTSGGRPSVTFKSWPTKGQPTRHVGRKNRFLIFTPTK